MPVNHSHGSVCDTQLLGRGVGGRVCSGKDYTLRRCPRNGSWACGAVPGSRGSWGTEQTQGWVCSQGFRNVKMFQIWKLRCPTNTTWKPGGGGYGGRIQGASWWLRGRSGCAGTWGQKWTVMPTVVTSVAMDGHELMCSSGEN